MALGASAKAGELVTYAREILRALGVLADEPTLITTDNLANYKVASGAASPSRSLHFLRRYFVLRQRIASGEVRLIHVPDESQPADFLTKFLRAPKLKVSLRYATDAGARDDTGQPNSPSSLSILHRGVGSGGLLEACPATWHSATFGAILPSANASPVIAVPPGASGTSCPVAPEGPGLSG